MYKFRITVFTPTYNRGYIIGKLFESLKRQSFQDFEWLVVDDGSTDNTEEIFQNFSKENIPFDIRYIKVSNGGKHRAINKGLDLAQGELFFTVDSDDELTNNALEKIDVWEKSLKNDNKKFAGIVANRGYTKDKTVNHLFKEEYLDMDLLKIYSYEEDGYKVLGGERAFIFYTDIHKKYKYPEIENENFMTEAVTWNRMAKDGYYMRFYNDIIWIFKYLEDGLTRKGNQLFIDNPKGYVLWLREKNIYEGAGRKDLLKLNYMFLCEFCKQYSLKQIIEILNISVIQLIILWIIYKIKH